MHVGRQESKQADRRTGNAGKGGRQGRRKQTRALRSVTMGPWCQLIWGPGVSYYKAPGTVTIRPRDQLLSGPGISYYRAPGSVTMRPRGPLLWGPRVRYFGAPCSKRESNIHLRTYRQIFMLTEQPGPPSSVAWAPGFPPFSSALQRG